MPASSPPPTYRYPYEILDPTTDWFRIQAYTYESAGSGSAGTSVGVSTNSLITSGLGNLIGNIILPMPSNLQDGNSVSYDENSINPLTAGGLQAIGNTINTDLGSNAVEAIGNISGKIASQTKAFFNEYGPDVKKLVLKGLAAEAVSVFGGNVTLSSILARESGQILNPNMELLFSGVTLRTFRFSFKMTPRDNDESDQIKNIIRFLKTNMSPRSGTSDVFLSTPNIFDLSYRKGGSKHPFLHSFKACFLKDMSVNYTGENTYVTYSDGTPISIVMDLTFQEIEPIYAKDYNDIPVTQGVGY